MQYRKFNRLPLPIDEEVEKMIWGGRLVGGPIRSWIFRPVKILPKQGFVYSGILLFQWALCYYEALEKAGTPENLTWEFYRTF